MTLESWPPQFTIDQERILTLLTGDRFYSNPSAAMREAVLNAIDAVARRYEQNPGIEPIIKVTFDREQLTMEVRDNGDGMSKSQIRSLFTRIGASAANMNLNTSPVGEFGIGVVSYFMAGDRFRLHTCDGKTPSIGLSFDKSLLAGGQAQEVSPRQVQQGTTLTIELRDPKIFDTILANYQYWCRYVRGLTARLLPEGRSLDQGGLRTDAAPVAVPAPDWVESTHLFPVSGPKEWTEMTDTSEVSVLYRGVFVQKFEAHRLWGIQGSVDVDPKHFKPRLNREGFIGSDFESELIQFLQSCHPTVLRALAEHLRAAHDNGDLNAWTTKQWASLWLAVPRTGAYQSTLEYWDSIFRTLPAFEVATPNTWVPASLDEISRLPTPIFVSPLRDEKTNDQVRAAVRVLRNTHRSVIRGIRYDRAWMRRINRPFGTTADLIMHAFPSAAPGLVSVAGEAESILSAICPVTALFAGPPKVTLSRMGGENPAALRLKKDLVINIDNESGRQMVLDAIDSNLGPLALVTSASIHAYDQLQQVAAVVRQLAKSDDLLSPIRRREIRRILK